MRMSFYALTLMSALSLPVAAQNYGPKPDAATTSELLTLRERAWRSWFSNDVSAFKAVVPDELVAMGWSDGPWADRDETLKQMALFAAGGTTLTALSFPENVFQQYADVVILYTRFRLTLRSKEGTENHLRGRGTEIFVKRNKRWIHTGWHLDTIGAKP